MTSLEATILLVDDDLDLRDSIADLLAIRKLGQCVGVGSLAEAKAQADHILHCALAILDINLGPGPSGVEVYRWLVEAGFRGQIVFLTGYGADDSRVQEAHRIGLQILTKPISTDRLYALAAGHQSAE